MFPLRLSRFSLMIAAGVLLLAGTTVVGQRGTLFRQSRDHAAVNYSTGAVHDDIAELNRRIQSGETHLQFEPTRGYLRSVLAALGIPTESQVAVFSPTSFQAPLINRGNPRALYFNDHVAIGWVRGGVVLEVAVQDPRQGVVFYKLDQQETATPQFKRNDGCLGCHVSLDTLGVPGLLVMSSFPAPPGNAGYAVAQMVDHRSPLEERWGGWYVTGDAGVGHMGNGAATGDNQDWTAERHTPVWSSLEGQFDLNGYLTPYSDVVALMVLEHQAHATNLLTRLNWEARIAASSSDPAGAARVRVAVDELVDYFLFVDEEPLKHQVRGSSGFAEYFAGSGIADARGRSLRQLNLKTYLMRYPCSYMVYSAAFDALPDDARDAVYQKMWQVLSGDDKDPRYQRLTQEDRQAVIEILRDTKKGLPDYFHSTS